MPEDLRKHEGEKAERIDFLVRCLRENLSIETTGTGFGGLLQDLSPEEIEKKIEEIKETWTKVNKIRSEAAREITEATNPISQWVMGIYEERNKRWQKEEASEK